MGSLKERLRHYFHELASIHSSEHEVAVGFAVGILIAILPTPGISIPLAALSLLLYPKMSKIALFGALVLLNPVTLIPFQLLSYTLGTLIFGKEQVIWYNVVLLNRAVNFTRHYLVGNLIVATTMASAGYFAARGIVRGVRSRRSKKEAREREEGERETTEREGREAGREKGKKERRSLRRDSR